MSTSAAPAINPWQAFDGTRRSGRTRDLLSLGDFEAAARRVLPRPIFGYIAGAAEDNHALADNRQAFDELALVPRVLCNVAQREQGHTVRHALCQPLRHCAHGHRGAVGLPG